VLAFRAWPGPGAGRLRDRARREADARSWDRAEADLAALARLRPLDAEERLLRAEVARARGRPDEALASLAGIPDDDPRSARAHLVAGQVELRRQRARAAEHHFLRSLGLDPSLIQAHRELVYIDGMQLRRREIDAQFRALARLTTLDFGQVFVWCLSRKVDWEPSGAAATLGEFVAADPDDRWSRLALAENLRRMGQPDRAGAVLAPLPAADPEALALRAQLALDRHDEAGASELLQAGPEGHAALEQLRGQMAFARGDGLAAIRHFRAADDAEPNHRETLFGLGRALQMTGDRQAAEPILKAARDLDAVWNLLLEAETPGARAQRTLPRRLGAACEAARLVPQARAWYRLAIARDPLDAESQAALYRLKDSAE
jgi:predicted Zn-dependent protease